MRFDIQVDATEIIDSLRGMEGQMRFAMSKALNDTANDAQKAIQDGLGQRFTLRRPDFVKRTIKRNREDFATKEKLEAVVRIDPTRDVLAKHESGGTKTPRAGRAIALPTEHVRRTKAQIIGKAQRPKALLATGKAFAKGAQLLTRVGRGAKALLRVAYVFKPSVQIKPTLGFVDTANKAVDRQWAQRAQAAIDRVIATLR